MISSKYPAAQKKIQQIAALADDIPGVVIIHEVRDFRLVYMSPVGLSLLGKEWEEIAGLTGAEYHERFFHPEFADHVLPKLLNLLETNSNETFSFFQQVRTGPGGDWEWYMSMIKILMRDESGQPLLTITTAMKIDPNHYFTTKMSRLFEENKFLREHHERFSTLTKREKEILKLLASGSSSAAIAEKLFISVATAETHRKKIKQKLGAKSSFELTRFAQAFDLL